MTLLSWDIPLISFNGSLWDVLLRCSKWLLGAWLDSFTMILRCWLVVWVKWARPLVSMTLWSRICSIEKRFNWKDGPFHGRPTPLKVNGANFSTLLPPGVQLLPHFEVWSYRACQPLQMWKFHISVKSTLWATRRQFFFAMLSQWGKFGMLLPPGVQLLPHFEVWSYRACQPLQMWQISHFCEIHFLSYEASKFFSMLSQCVWFCPYFALGQTIVPRSLIKVIAHDPD